MFIQIIILILGLILLYIGSEFLVNGSSSTALMFSVKPVIVGLTIVSFATSAPELLVSFIAAFKGSSDIAVGNILGSNVINIALVLGISAIIHKISINKQIIKFELPCMIFISIVFWILCLDCNLGHIDGTILLLFLFIFLIISIKNAKTKDKNNKLPDRSSKKLFINTVLVIIGIFALAFGANMVVQNAIYIAKAIGLSEIFIGISIVALGTSLPELATSAVAAAKGHSDISVGNVVGSNIFNICLVMGIVGICNPTNVNKSLLYFEIPFMVFLSIIFYIISIKYKKLNTLSGLAFIIFFLIYNIISYNK
ncbi:MAG: calcium/sodium antiporter [Desulfobacteraceae bacterium]|nr:calcium/sodium antiporter [Desulfobacteraceae bacterium]